VSFRRRTVVDAGVIDCGAVLGVVVIDLVAKMARFEFGVQFGVQRPSGVCICVVEAVIGAPSRFRG
jgi:hypothetical protein